MYIYIHTHIKTRKPNLRGSLYIYTHKYIYIYTYAYTYI